MGGQKLASRGRFHTRCRRDGGMAGPALFGQAGKAMAAGCLLVARGSWMGTLSHWHTAHSRTLNGDASSEPFWQCAGGRWGAARSLACGPWPAAGCRHSTASTVPHFPPFTSTLPRPKSAILGIDGLVGSLSNPWPAVAWANGSVTRRVFQDPDCRVQAASAVHPLRYELNPSSIGGKQTEPFHSLDLRKESWSRPN
jgi:hypothetical protein